MTGPQLDPIYPLLIQTLRGESTPVEAAIVAAWRRESPVHEQQYRELARVLHLTSLLAGQLDAGPPPPAASLIGKARTTSPATALPRRRALARPTVWAGAVAAVAALALIVLRLRAPAVERTELGHEEFFADSSGSSMVSLRDGTVIRLAAGSRLRLLRPADGREVVLQGRAYFAVARNPGQPFRIRSAAGDVTVLGTRFDLEVLQDDLRVVVVEGVVRLSARGGETTVRSGQTGQVVGGALLPVVAAPDLVDRVQWVGQFLAFQDTPLSQVAVEIQRLYGIPVQLADSMLNGRTVTAWFSGWSPDDVLRVVCMVVEARCTIEEGVVVVRPKS